MIQFDVLDGFVRIDSSNTDDMMVVNAARVSFGKRITEMTEADDKLIGFLMRERHGSPFEHNQFTFHIKCPIFVAREWFRHRIGSFNEFSARYTEMPNQAYLPEPSAVRTQVGKPGEYRFSRTSPEVVYQTREMIAQANAYAFEMYNHMLTLGVAKELARTVLPVGTYTEFYWTVNARSLMNFLSLRTSVHAQYEIREYASAVEQVFQTLMPITHKAWVDNDKLAP